jgi:hypothetical protein
MRAWEQLLPIDDDEERTNLRQHRCSRASADGPDATRMTRGGNSSTRSSQKTGTASRKLMPIEVARFWFNGRSWILS